MPLNDIHYTEPRQCNDSTTLVAVVDEVWVVRTGAAAVIPSLVDGLFMLLQTMMTSSGESLDLAMSPLGLAGDAVSGCQHSPVLVQNLHHHSCPAAQE